MRRIGVALAVVVVALVTSIVATARWGDRTLWPPAPGSSTITVFIVNHGYHAGIIVPRRALVEEASRRGLGGLGYIATRFDDFDNLEIGWGDEGFYREVPTMQSLTVALALRALFRPGNPSVLHVVGVNADPRASFGHSDLVRLELSAAGFARLADKLDASFARAPGGLRPIELGRGLYGTSLFFRANGTFHIFNVCNHWVADLLDAAGVPTAPAIATLPDGLLLDLAWRSGRERMPALNEPQK